jgi:arginine decarboxylase
MQILGLNFSLFYFNLINLKYTKLNEYKYSDLINQTYYFPQEEFKLKQRQSFHNIDLMKLVEQYGTPLSLPIYLKFLITSTRPKAGFVNRWKKK